MNCGAGSKGVHFMGFWVGHRKFSQLGLGRSFSYHLILFPPTGEVEVQSACVIVPLILLSACIICILLSFFSIFRVK
jgi:hypothetical protein